MRRPWPTGGCGAPKQKQNTKFNIFNIKVDYTNLSGTVGKNGRRHTSLSSGSDALFSTGKT